MIIYKAVYHIIFRICPPCLCICSSSSVPLAHERLDTDSAFFFSGLTYTNVLMDRGDKDNEGEERGDEEWRREGQYATHTRKYTLMRLEKSQGRQILWA